MAGPGIEGFRTLSMGQKVVIVALVVGLTLGLLVAPFAYDATVDPQPDRIAVVPIEGTIEAPNTQDVIERLVEVRQDDSVEAVVLLINSPGGFAVDGEEIFVQVERTAQKKPVVAIIGLQGTSAGYKAALPADEIYASPASSVGSVGSFLIRPQPIPPIDVVVETGPQKIDGQTPRGYEYRVAMTGGSFADTVMEFRGDELELTREELAHARIYNGIAATELGLIDGISDMQGAIQAAADIAELDSYEVTRLNYETEVRFLDQAAYASSEQPNKTTIEIDDIVDAEDQVVATELMLPATALSGLVEAEAEPANQTATETGGDDDGG